MLTTESNERWAYRCLMRPPMPGGIPREGLDYLDYREGYTPSGHHYWGRVIYTRELTKHELDQYELEETALAVLD